MFWRWRFWSETDALVAGLPAIPRKILEHRDVKLTEFDLDAALARKPQLRLVDELAHTNTPGSRHPQRWQAWRKLRDAGIDVFTTLNVQHVEIRETVPDSVLDNAEMELVDLPPAELLRRLREGKVYLPDRAAAAAQNFFKEGNMTALRELALRLWADTVGMETREYHRAQPGAGPWKTGHRLLVAVGPGPLSEPLIRRSGLFRRVRCRPPAWMPALPGRVRHAVDGPFRMQACHAAALSAIASRDPNAKETSAGGLQGSRRHGRGRDRSLRAHSEDNYRRAAAGHR